MWLKIMAAGLALAALSGNGCKKKPDTTAAGAGGTNQAVSTPASLGPTAPPSRIHWLGLKKISALPDATNFVAIWNLPETQALLGQTLKKFSESPWRPPHIGTNSFVTNAASALLEPLLADLVQEECFIRFSGNGGGRIQSLAVAVRLPADRSQAWQTNLQTVLQAVNNGPSGFENSTNGWRTRTPGPFGIAQFSRLADWTVVSFQPAANPSTPSAVLQDLTEHAFRTDPTNGLWLSEEVELSVIAPVIFPDLPNTRELPRLEFSLFGQNGLAQSHGTFTFAKPLPIKLDPWNIPTNLVHDPLGSFVAIRGLKNFLKDSPYWNALHLGEAPNQVYAWSQGGLPFISFIAFPASDASNRVEQSTPFLTNQGSAWIKTHAVGSIERATNGPGLTWHGLMLLDPWLQAQSLPEGSFVTAGLIDSSFTNKPPPPGLINQVLMHGDTVMYDWETTGARLQPWLYSGQLLRLAFYTAQVPPPSRSINWIMAVEHRLGNCTTRLTWTAPNQLSFARMSTIGLSSTEINLLVDWLESPDFPQGIHTFSAPPDRKRKVRTQTGTNSIPGKAK